MEEYTRFCAALVLAVLAASGATAEIKKIGEAAGWEVAIKEAIGPGCLITKSADHLQVQLGVNARSAEKTAYMAVFTRANVGVAEGDTLPVEFEIGGKTFKGEAFGEQMKGFQGAWVPVNNPDFVYDLAKEEMMKIMVSGLDPIEVRLAGTDAAFQAMR